MRLLAPCRGLAGLRGPVAEVMLPGSTEQQVVRASASVREDKTRSTRAKCTLTMPCGMRDWHSGRDEGGDEEPLSVEPRLTSSRTPRCHRVARAEAWIRSAVCDPTKTHCERVPPRRDAASSNEPRCFPSVGLESRVQDDSRGSLEFGDDLGLLRLALRERGETTQPFQPLAASWPL